MGEKRRSGRIRPLIKLSSNLGCAWYLSYDQKRKRLHINELADEEEPPNHAKSSFLIRRIMISFGSWMVEPGPWPQTDMAPSPMFMRPGVKSPKTFS